MSIVTENVNISSGQDYLGPAHTSLSNEPLNENKENFSHLKQGSYIIKNQGIKNINDLILLDKNKICMNQNSSEYINVLSDNEVTTNNCHNHFSDSPIVALNLPSPPVAQDNEIKLCSPIRMGTENIVLKEGKQIVLTNKTDNNFPVSCQAEPEAIILNQVLLKTNPKEGGGEFQIKADLKGKVEEFTTHLSETGIKTIVIKNTPEPEIDLKFITKADNELSSDKNLKIISDVERCSSSHLTSNEIVFLLNRETKLVHSAKEDSNNVLDKKNLSVTTFCSNSKNDELPHNIDLNLSKEIATVTQSHPTVTLNSEVSNISICSDSGGEHTSTASIISDNRLPVFKKVDNIKLTLDVVANQMITDHCINGVQKENPEKIKINLDKDEEKSGEPELSSCTSIQSQEEPNSYCDEKIPVGISPLSKEPPLIMKIDLLKKKIKFISDINQEGSLIQKGTSNLTDAVASKRNFFATIGMEPKRCSADSYPDNLSSQDLSSILVQDQTKTFGPIQNLYPRKIKTKKINKSKAAEQINSDDLRKPLDKGYRREVVYRLTATIKDQCDIYYRPPVGPKLRSMVDVRKHLEKTTSEFSENNFSFSHYPLGFGEPLEVVRNANQSCGRHSNDNGSNEKPTKNAYRPLLNQCKDISSQVPKMKLKMNRKLLNIKSSIERVINSKTLVDVTKATAGISKIRNIIKIGLNKDDNMYHILKNRKSKNCGISGKHLTPKAIQLDKSRINNINDLGNTVVVAQEELDEYCHVRNWQNKDASISFDSRKPLIVKFKRNFKKTENKKMGIILEPSSESINLGASYKRARSQEKIRQNFKRLKSNDNDNNCELLADFEKEEKCRNIKRRKLLRKPVSPAMNHFYEVIHEVVKDNKGLKTYEISKIIDNMWRNLSTDERKKYEDAYADEMVAFNTAISETSIADTIKDVINIENTSLVCAETIPPNSAKEKLVRTLVEIETSTKENKNFTTSKEPEKVAANNIHQNTTDKLHASKSSEETLVKKKIELTPSETSSVKSIHQNGEELRTNNNNLEDSGKISFASKISEVFNENLKITDDASMGHSNAPIPVFQMSVDDYCEVSCEDSSEKKTFKIAIDSNSNHEGENKNHVVSSPKRPRIRVRPLEEMMCDQPNENNCIDTAIENCSPLQNLCEKLQDQNIITSQDNFVSSKSNVFYPNHEQLPLISTANVISSNQVTFSMENLITAVSSPMTPAFSNLVNSPNNLQNQHVTTYISINNFSPANYGFVAQPETSLVSAVPVGPICSLRSSPVISVMGVNSNLQPSSSQHLQGLAVSPTFNGSPLTISVMPPNSNLQPSSSQHLQGLAVSPTFNGSPLTISVMPPKLLQSVNNVSAYNNCNKTIVLVQDISSVSQNSNLLESNINTQLISPAQTVESFSSQTPNVSKNSILLGSTYSNSQFTTKNSVIASIYQDSNLQGTSDIENGSIICSRFESLKQKSNYLTNFNKEKPVASVASTFLLNGSICSSSDVMSNYDKNVYDKTKIASKGTVSPPRPIPKSNFATIVEPQPAREAILGTSNRTLIPLKPISKLTANKIVNIQPAPKVLVSTIKNKKLCSSKISNQKIVATYPCATSKKILGSEGANLVSVTLPPIHNVSSDLVSTSYQLINSKPTNLISVLPHNKSLQKIGTHDNTGSKSPTLNPVSVLIPPNQSLPNFGTHTNTRSNSPRLNIVSTNLSATSNQKKNAIPVLVSENASRQMLIAPKNSNCFVPTNFTPNVVSTDSQPTNLISINPKNQSFQNLGSPVSTGFCTSTLSSSNLVSSDPCTTLNPSIDPQLLNEVCVKPAPKPGKAKKTFKLRNLSQMAPVVKENNPTLTSVTPHASGSDTPILNVSTHIPSTLKSVQSNQYQTGSVNPELRSTTGSCGVINQPFDWLSDSPYIYDNIDSIETMQPLQDKASNENPIPSVFSGASNLGGYLSVMEKEEMNCFDSSSIVNNIEKDCDESPPLAIISEVYSLKNKISENLFNDDSSDINKNEPFNCDLPPVSSQCTNISSVVPDTISHGTTGASCFEEFSNVNKSTSIVTSSKSANLNVNNRSETINKAENSDVGTIVLVNFNLSSLETYEGVLSSTEVFAVMKIGHSQFGELLAIRTEKNGQQVYVPASGTVVFSSGSLNNEQLKNVKIINFKLHDDSLLNNNASGEKSLIKKVVRPTPKRVTSEDTSLSNLSPTEFSFDLPESINAVET